LGEGAPTIDTAEPTKLTPTESVVFSEEWLLMKEAVVDEKVQLPSYRINGLATGTTQTVFSCSIVTVETVAWSYQLYYKVAYRLQVA
jgi:hypothetical protein